ncbi:28887_t:CDS:2, partial [Racocetra persica]
MDKAFDHLFLQLKSKVQQAKSVMLLFNLTLDDTENVYMVITCYWLTENFEFHKILLGMSVRFEFNFNNLILDCIEILNKRKLNNLKFISATEILYDLFYLFEANDNKNAQGMSNIITAILNAFDNFNSIIEFLKDQRIKKEVNTSIGNLQRARQIDTYDFITEKPLQHTKVTSRNIIKLLTDDFNILNEISPITLSNELSQFTYYYSKVTSSFDNTLDGSIQNLANDELEHYINYQQFFDEDFNLYKWWQSSKTTFPGLANLASEYLLLASNNEIQLDNLDKFENVYKNDDM